MSGTMESGEIACPLARGWRGGRSAQFSGSRYITRIGLGSLLAGPLPIEVKTEERIIGVGPAKQRAIRPEREPGAAENRVAAARTVGARDIGARHNGGHGTGGAPDGRVGVRGAWNDDQVGVLHAIMASMFIEHQLGAEQYADREAVQAGDVISGPVGGEPGRLPPAGLRREALLAVQRDHRPVHDGDGLVDEAVAMPGWPRCEDERDAELGEGREAGIMGGDRIFRPTPVEIGFGSEPAAERQLVGQ